MPSVSIVIPTWNGRELLARFLPSVIVAASSYTRQSGCEVEVVVVDDGSTDDTADWLEAKRRESSLVRPVIRPINGGFSVAANEGFRAARHPIVLLLNNDVRIESDAIAPLVSHFDDANVFAVCCRALRLDTELLDGGGKLGFFERGFWRVFLNYDVAPERRWSQPLHSFFGSGGYTAYDRHKLVRLGGFCELMSPAFWEDVDLCYRAWKRGWEVRYEPRSLVHHISSATTGSPAFRRISNVITERNRLMMTWVNLHDRRWLLSHLFWVLLKSLGALVSFDLDYLRATRQALSSLKEVTRLRHAEQSESRRSDREIDQLFRELARQESIQVIRDGG